MFCPNYNSEEWKYLEYKVGNELDHKILIASNGIPDINTIDEISMSLDNTGNVNYKLNSINILLSYKAKQIFYKGAKNGYTL